MSIRLTLGDGIIEGSAAAGIHRFLSIPYAAAVTTERRFRAPQPVEPWSGVRDATRAGPSAPQSHGDLPGIDFAPFIGRPGALGSDYLTLNVWAPENALNAPVMVFIHGGSFIAGSKDAAVYDGSAFARDGVVCVAINYRLGAEGFLPVPGVPTNLGLRDAIAALRWVRDNIAAFGGDSGKVTLFGESAGAAMVALLMLSPLATGLFVRAICQSGHAELTRDVAAMQPLVKRLARKLRIAPDQASFAGTEVQALLDAQAWATKPGLGRNRRDEDGLDLTFGSAGFVPVHGDDVLPERPIRALKSGAGGAIDLLIGTNSEEANLFFVPGGAGDRIRGWQAWLAARFAVRTPLTLLRAYGFGQPGIRPGTALMRAMTDLFFRAIARRSAELHRGRSWVYEFDWRSPALGGTLGGAHAIELPFVFDTLAAASGPDGVLGERPPQGLADSIHALWVAFAKNEALPWPEYDSTNRMVWSLTCGVAEPEPLTPAAAYLP